MLQLFHEKCSEGCHTSPDNGGIVILHLKMFELNYLIFPSKQKPWFEPKYIMNDIPIFVFWLLKCTMVVGVIYESFVILGQQQVASGDSVSLYVQYS